MKDRVRKTVFDLLGPTVVGTHAIDLFGGTGVLALEAISRGAVSATIIERHIPTTQLITRNCAALGVQDIVDVVAADTFYWARTMPPFGPTPWTVFCSPPYILYESQSEDMIELIETLLERAPANSSLIVESNTSFDAGSLPDAENWQVRDYAPARLSTRIG